MVYSSDMHKFVKPKRIAAVPGIRHLICVYLMIPVLSLADSSSATQFSRIDKGESMQPRALQVAVVSYVPKDGPANMRVDLLSAIHIGDAAYYAALNERFRTYDALLYELVAPEGTVISPEAESKSVLSAAQRGMRTMLDLTYQLEEIDYTQSNFVHADLTPDELSASMAERGESLYTYFWKIIFASMREAQGDPAGVKGLSTMVKALRSGNKDPMKVLLAYDFANLDKFSGMLGDDATSAIIGARNARAIDVLMREIDAGQRYLGIFYGAAHMRDLENRLLQVGFVKDETTWLDAWAL